MTDDIHKRIDRIELFVLTDHIYIEEVPKDDLQWLVTTLRSSLKQNEIMREALETISDNHCYEHDLCQHCIAQSALKTLEDE